MYIVVSDTKRKVGFKGLEVNDLIFGLPLFIILLLLFSFESMRMISLILLVISVFMFLPINLSKKNRMYKIMYLAFSYLKRKKEYIYFKHDKKEGLNGFFNREEIKKIFR